MAEDGIIARRQQGSHPTALAGQKAMTDRVDAAVDGMKASARQPMPDLMARHAQRQQLAPSNHPVLVPGELGDSAVHSTPVKFGRPDRHKFTTIAHAPMVARGMRRGAR